MTQRQNSFFILCTDCNKAHRIPPEFADDFATCPECGKKMPFSEHHNYYNMGKLHEAQIALDNESYTWQDHIEAIDYFKSQLHWYTQWKPNMLERQGRKAIVDGFFTLMAEITSSLIFTHVGLRFYPTEPTGYDIRDKGDDWKATYAETDGTNQRDWNRLRLFHQANQMKTTRLGNEFLVNAICQRAEQYMDTLESWKDESLRKTES